MIETLDTTRNAYKLHSHKLDTITKSNSWYIELVDYFSFWRKKIGLKNDKIAKSFDLVRYLI